MITLFSDSLTHPLYSDGVDDMAERESADILYYRVSQRPRISLFQDLASRAVFRRLL